MTHLTSLIDGISWTMTLLFSLKMACPFAKPQIGTLILSSRSVPTRSERVRHPQQNLQVQLYL